MSEFNFKSSVCTSIEQSKRLIALGLKKTTADCVWIEMSKGDWRVDANGWKEYYSIVEEGIVPAWSLGRLVEDLMPEKIGEFDTLASLLVSKRKVQYYFHDVEYSEYLTSAGCWKGGDVYDNAIDCIEWLIKEGYFPEEYLDE